ncbi:MAG: hypothetical protein ACI9N1_001151 [Flavobacteriales bacterium]|jgi:hypothetical protein
MTYSTIIKNWLITIIIGSSIAGLLFALGGIPNTSFLQIITSFFGGMLYMSIASLIASLPFIIGLALYIGYSPISTQNWRKNYVLIHIVATIFNILVISLLSENGAIGPLSLVSLLYMIIGIITWHHSIKKVNTKI